MSMYGWFYLEQTWKWPMWTIGIAFLPPVALLIYFCEDPPRPWYLLGVAVLSGGIPNIGPLLSSIYPNPYWGIWTGPALILIFRFVSKLRKAK